MAEKKIAWTETIGKALLYIGIPVVAIIAVYKLIENLLLGPGRDVLELWKQQYKDFLEELKQFTAEDEGNLTAEHQNILDIKEKVMQQTAATYGQITGRIYELAALALGIGFGLAALYFAPAIISKWKGIVKKNVQSSTGQGYIAMCMMADDLAVRGYPTQATALSTIITTRFNVTDKPFMQSQVAYYQSLLPTLIGWQLLYAQYIINAYTIEIAAIPIWITYLPPLI